MLLESAGNAHKCEARLIAVWAAARTSGELGDLKIG